MWCCYDSLPEYYITKSDSAVSSLETLKIEEEITAICKLNLCSTKTEIVLKYCQGYFYNPILVGFFFLPSQPFFLTTDVDRVKHKYGRFIYNTPVMYTITALYLFIKWLCVLCLILDIHRY